MRLENDGRFYQIGEVQLPEGHEGRELHFYISRGKIEVWLLPGNPSPEHVGSWLNERREANKCTA
jgi:hypothetical protein